MFFKKHKELQEAKRNLKKELVIARAEIAMLTHEKNCHANPHFNCCENCVHAIMKDFIMTDDWNRGAEPYCNHHNDYIFGESKSERPYFLECETADCSYGMREEVPVPYTCHHFESKGTHGFPLILKT